MSKQIDWTKPLSDEDRAWAEQFPGLYAGLLQANAEQFPQTAEPSLDGQDAEEAPYTEWTAAELADEAKRRNAEEGKNLPVSGKKADLVKALEADDEASVQ
jgi:hypothetical protein